MNDQLPMTIPDRWTVEPIFYRQSKAEIASGKPREVKFYALEFGGEIQKKATTERETESLRDMAKFLNRRNLTPRPRVQCVADTNVPPLPKKKAHKPAPQPTP